MRRREAVERQQVLLGVQKALSKARRALRAAAALVDAHARRDAALHALDDMRSARRGDGERARATEDPFARRASPHVASARRAAPIVRPCRAPRWSAPARPGAELGAVSGVDPNTLSALLSTARQGRELQARALHGAMTGLCGGRPAAAAWPAGPECPVAGEEPTDTRDQPHVEFAALIGGRFPSGGLRKEHERRRDLRGRGIPRRWPRRCYSRDVARAASHKPAPTTTTAMISTPIASGASHSRVTAR